MPNSNILAIIDSNPNVMLKPILFTDYEAVTKYNLVITYEDSTTKKVELVQNDKTRPYKVVYKKNGQLVSVIGVPKVYEINEASKYCDFVNRTMDSKDLLFEMDCSNQFECTKARFYLKDIRDIIDIVSEGLLEDPEDNMEVGSFTMYPIYLNEHSCQNTIHCTVDENNKVTLTARVTKMGETLTSEEYSEFTILSVTSPVIVDSSIFSKVNQVPLIIPEEMLDKEFKVILKYFIKEINHPVFDEFTVIASRKSEEDETVESAPRAVTTQTMKYLGDNVDELLDIDLTPGYKQFRYTE